jgi:tetratricopeptide (TPR) repeat protein
MTRRIALLVAVLAVAHAAPAVAQPSEAERLYTSGQKAYDEKRYDDALAAWEKSYALSRLPGLLFNVAQAYRLRNLPGDCAKAAETYEKFLQLDRNSPQRANAQKLLAELQGCSSAEHQRNATLPLTFTPPPAPTQPQAQPQPQPLPVAPVSESGRGTSKRTIAYIVGGGSLALVATGFYFGHKAKSLGDEVTAACAKGCDWATVADKDAAGHSAAKMQWVFYGLGAAGLATAGVLYVLGGSESSHVAVAPHADGAVMSWTGHW